MRKVKLYVISVLGCLVLVIGFGILTLIAADSTDQVLTYSTFLGGKRDDYCRDIAVDSFGNVYVTGLTRSVEFPTTMGDPYTTGYVTFVAKLDSIDPGILNWSSLLGGGGHGLCIALDAEGQYVYIAGVTGSSEFHTTDGSNLGVEDISIYVAKFENNGLLVFSTVIGEGGFSEGVSNNGVGLAVNRENGDDFIYLTGVTKDPDLFIPHGAPLEEFAGGTSDGFVAKFDQTGNPADPLQLVYGRFLGGTGDDRPGGIAVDADACAHITGKTSSLDFPTVNGYQGTLIGQTDVFVTKLDSAGSFPLYSTYLGGNDGPGAGSDDESFDIAIDTAGMTYVTGRTASPDFPTTTGAFQNQLNGSADAFVVLLNPTQVGVDSLLYSSYLGGSTSARGFSVAVDEDGNVYVFGRTLSKDFPTSPNAIDPTYNGRHDDWLSKMNPILEGNASLISSTYWGGRKDDEPGGIALYTDGVSGLVSIYLCGSTGSGTDFPISPGAYDSSYNGGQTDAFVSILEFQETTEQPPAAPTDLTAKARGRDKISLKWKDNSNNEDGFRIYRSLDGIDFSIQDLVGQNTTLYVDTGLFSGQTYYYKICSYNVYGESCSNVDSASTK